MERELTPKEMMEAAINDARLSVRKCLEEHGYRCADGDDEQKLIDAITIYAYDSNFDL